MIPQVAEVAGSIPVSGLSRRSFLRGLALGGAIIAGELWIPGKKLISIPKVPRVEGDFDISAIRYRPDKTWYIAGDYARDRFTWVKAWYDPRTFNLYLEDVSGRVFNPIPDTALEELPRQIRT